MVSVERLVASAHQAGFQLGENACKALPLLARGFSPDSDEVRKLLPHPEVLTTEGWRVITVLWASLKVN